MTRYGLVFDTTQTQPEFVSNERLFVVLMYLSNLKISCIFFILLPSAD